MLFKVRSSAVVFCWEFLPAVLGISAFYSEASADQAQGKVVEFNVGALSSDDLSNIDVSEFSRAGYILPGEYEMLIRLNNTELSTETIRYVESTEEADGVSSTSVACLSPEVVAKLALNAKSSAAIAWSNDGKCLDISSVPGMTVRGDLGRDTLFLTIPQAYLEYSAPNWDPPSRWDDGIPGLILDYNLNAQSDRDMDEGESQSFSGNGTTGANWGAWRLRADWQYSQETGLPDENERTSEWNWTRFYSYRAIPALKAKLTVGEDYLRSNVFDSFRFVGASLETDEQMLPPNLRGYAPEVSGVVQSNAKVTVSQQGRVLYETLVPPGPFRIQDLSSAVSGKLDVRVEEQDGRVQEYQVDTANIPFLTRPGSVRYKLSAGRPTDWDHKMQGDAFGSGEISWGISNGWSVYGGLLGAGDYNAASLGIGRDLMDFGAISLDVTNSRASLPQESEELTGKSYRVSYSKRFEEYGSNISLAGYRFADRDFMSMSQYLDRRFGDEPVDSNKDLYTLTLGKQFSESRSSMHLGISRQSYWNRGDDDRFDLSYSKSLDFGSLRNVSLTVSAYKTVSESTDDYGAFVSVSLPWGDGGTVSYSGSFSEAGNSNSGSYYKKIDDNNNYRISAGTGIDGRPRADGYYTHYGDRALLTASASYQDDSSSAFGLQARGGLTMTSEGSALHRINTPGDSRVLVDTNGVSGVPVRGNGALTHTNSQGKAVVADVSDYYRNKISIDLDALPEKAEAIRSIQQATLTEGAIGYRKLEVVAGEKVMALINLESGGKPPFGAVVLSNKSSREIGIVNDDGSAYLSGVESGEVLGVRWDGKLQCVVTLPDELESADLSTLDLKCKV